MKQLKNGIFLILVAISLSFTTTPTPIVILIDVGHGGHDSGTRTDNFEEKKITLQIAKKIQELSKDSNIKIILTRDNDTFVGLKERVLIINNHQPDYVISLHVNAAKNEEQKGWEFIIAPPEKRKNTKTYKMTDKLHSTLSNTFETKPILERGYYLLKEVNQPICMIEMGYLTNHTERKLLTNTASQIKIAEKLFESFLELSNTP